MLKVENLNVHYGSTQILWNVSLQVSAGEIAAIMGPNGSGKSTILKAIIGLVKASSGAVTLDGETLLGVPTHEMLARRVGLIMERRCLFPAMSVMENVRMGAFHPVAAAQFDENLAWVRSLFPLIDEKANAAAGQLSGGQQQMVAIARGLMGAPRYLMMDEPFLGLSPRIVDQIADVMLAVKDRGIAVIFNEQNAHLSFSLSDRGYLLESGRIVIEGSGLGMLENDKIRQVYLGMETAGKREMAMSFELFVTQILNGLVSGSMYALIGAGVALIYGTQRILNFAQGEFFMLAAFGLFVFSTQLGLPLVVSAIAAVVLVTAFSALVYRAAIQPLMNREGWEFSTIAVTLGISVLLQNIAFLLWGEKYQTVPYYLDGSIGFAGVTMPLQRVLVFLTCVSVIVAMTLFLKYSRTGWAIRATAQQPDAAAVVGVPVQRIRMLTFAIGCGLAAIAAVVLAPIFAVNPWIGVPHLLKGFVVVIMGGIGSFPGAILAGFVLGIVEAIGITLTSSEWRDVIAFATVILVIWLRPSGLLGKS